MSRNAYDAEDLIDALTECLDRKGCDGFTIWISPDGRLQVNMRDKKTQSWNCILADELAEGLARATGTFLRDNRNDVRRVVKVPPKKRREISDLA